MLKKKLPKNSDDVLINLSGSGVFMASYTVDKEWALYYSDAGRTATKHHQLNITHWMPLPETPNNY